MASSEQRFGQSLPDQVERIAALFDSHLDLLGEVRDLHRDYVTIERDFAAKMQALSKRANEKKSKLESALVVGSEPTKTWNQGVFEQNSLWSAYNEFTSFLSKKAQDHNALADALLSQIVETLRKVGKKYEDIKKKEMNFFQKLVSDRDKTTADCSKTKQKYDEDCIAADASRQKHAKAQDDKHASRAAKQVEQQRVDMLNSKNSYIISLAIANKTKAKFYGEDLPALEDAFQVVQTRMILKFSSVLQHSQALQVKHLDGLRTHHAAVETSFQQVDPAKDQNLFIDYNIRPFVAPPDMKFEPCLNHYDTEDMSVEPSPKVFLQNKLGRCRTKLRELEPVIESKQRELSQYSKLVYAYESDHSLGQVDDISEQFLDASQQAVFYGTSKCILNAEIDAITGAVGDDEGNVQPHSFKSSSFSIPTQCGYCQSSIWGLSKQGKVCKQCGLSVHSKCELKVPANCQQSSPSRISSTIPRKAPPTESLSYAIPTASSFVHANEEDTAEDYPTASMLYDFEASSEFELSVTEGSLVRVLEPDDGSGWVKILDSSNDSGLVPSTYIEYGKVESSSTVQSVRALYDYQAQGADELSLKQGDIVTLTSGSNGGQEYGEGWWEGLSLDGQKGIFPSNYVERV